MGARVCLTQEKDLYLVLKYETSDIPHLKICFLYNNRTKKETLIKARDFAGGMSEKLHLPLEEKLDNASDN